MRRVAGTVENRQIDPRPIRIETGCPNDAGNPGCLQIEFRNRCFRLPDRRVMRARRRCDFRIRDVLVDQRADAVIHAVRSIQIADQIIAQLQAPALHILQPAIERHALQRKSPQVDIPAAIAAGEIMVGLFAHRFALRMLIHGQIILPQIIQP